MPHLDACRFDIEIAVQIPLAERPPALPEVEPYLEIVLHDILDLPDPVAGKEVGTLPRIYKKRW